MFESVSTPHPVGVVLAFCPRAVGELTEVDLRGSLAEVAIPTAGLVYYNRYSQRIWLEPCGQAAGYNGSQFLVHRGELQLILLMPFGKASVPIGCTPAAT